MEFESFAPKVFLLQSGGLYKHVFTLSELYFSAEKKDQTALAIACFLTAAAAVEAIVVEASIDINPELYSERRFLRAGAPQKYKKLMGVESDEIKEIWSIRIALAHSEPENTRSTRFGEHINEDGVRKLLKQLEAIVTSIHGAVWPKRYIR